MEFSELSLHPSLMQSIEELKYNQATPIQAACIPLIREGKDVAGLAQTGTGKTAAFVMPLMDRILRSQESDLPAGVKPFSEWKKGHFVLVLVPTRELAEQVMESVEKLGKYGQLSSVAIYGGTSYDKQKEGMARRVEFVVATPGRLIDLYKENIVDLKQVRAVVFDEADRMFDMGFKDDMKYILQRLPKERQFLVFSATLNFEVLNTAYQFGAEPVEVNVSRDQAKAENVEDSIFHVGHSEKPSYLLSLLKKHQPKQAIIFSNFKNNVENLSRFLNQNGVPSLGISSLLTQAQRNRVLEQFKAENHQNILVATDVAARGLDIQGVDMVINYELPMDSESYVHRIGRTGRAGTTGQAFSLVCDRDVDSLARIEEYLKHKLTVGWMDDEALIKEFVTFREEREDRKKPFAPREGGSGGGGPRREGRSGQDRGPRRHGKDSGSGKRPHHSGGQTAGQPAHAEKSASGSAPGSSQGASAHPHQGGQPSRPFRRGGNSAEGSRRQEGHQARGGGDNPRSGKDRHGSSSKHSSSHGKQAGRRDSSAHAGKKSHAHAGVKPARKPQASLGQKVKKFFKSLFGN